jgi:hypothetical protein
VCDGHGHWSPVAVEIRNFLSIESEGKKPEKLNVRVDKVRKGREKRAVGSCELPIPSA